MVVAGFPSVDFLLPWRVCECNSLYLVWWWLLLLVIVSRLDVVTCDVS